MDETDLGFTYTVRGNGTVLILRHGQPVTTLRGPAAQNLLDRAATLSAAGLQQLLARLTGNYRRGNERKAASHPRNRMD